MWLNDREDPRETTENYSKIRRSKWKDMYSVKSWYLPQYVTAVGPKVSLEKIDTETIPVDGNFMAVEEELDIALNAQGMFILKIETGDDSGNL